MDRIKGRRTIRMAFAASIAMAAIGWISWSVGMGWDISRLSRHGPTEPSSVTIILDDFPVHTKKSFMFTLTNHDSRPMKVAGTPGFCQKHGCVSAVDPPKTIPPRESVRFHYRCEAELTGPIAMDTEIYLSFDAKEGVIVPVHVTGNVVPSEHDWSSQ